jgi:hypothetical protein
MSNVAWASALGFLLGILVCGAAFSTDEEARVCSLIGVVVFVTALILTFIRVAQGG